MSLFARLDDAQVLYEQGRLHGALLSLLVAIAATSRKRYFSHARRRRLSDVPEERDAEPLWFRLQRLDTALRR